MFVCLRGRVHFPDWHSGQRVFNWTGFNRKRLDAASTYSHISVICSCHEMIPSEAGGSLPPQPYNPYQRGGMTRQIDVASIAVEELERIDRMQHDMAIDSREREAYVKGLQDEINRLRRALDVANAEMVTVTVQHEAFIQGKTDAELTWKARIEALETPVFLRDKSGAVRTARSFRGDWAQMRLFYKSEARVAAALLPPERRAVVPYDSGASSSSSRSYSHRRPRTSSRGFISDSAVSLRRSSRPRSSVVATPIHGRAHSVEPTEMKTAASLVPAAPPAARGVSLPVSMPEPEQRMVDAALSRVRGLASSPTDEPVSVVPEDDDENGSEANRFNNETDEKI